MAPLVTTSSLQSADARQSDHHTSPAVTIGMPCSCLFSAASRVLLLFNQRVLPRASCTAPTFDAAPVRELVASTVDQFFRAAAEHPLLKPALRLSAAFTQACQIQFQNSSSLVRSQNAFSGLNFAAILPGDSLAGLVVANGITNFLNIYNTLLVVRLLLTWFPNAPPAIVSPLSTLCDPYLNIFRGIIPPLGGTLDLSPILAFLVLNAFTSTAAALPAEMPASGSSHRVLSSRYHWDLTMVQEKWLRRLMSKQNRSEHKRGFQEN